MNLFTRYWHWTTLTMSAPTPAAASVAATIQTYCNAWCEADRAARTSLLDQVWASEGSYTDPLSDVAGRGALNDLIGGFHQQYPGARIVPASGIDQHHGRLRFGWRLLLADGTVAIEGIDFCELSPDGRIARIVGFFGPLPGMA